MQDALRPFPIVSDIRAARASESQRKRGVIAWVCCLLDGWFQLDGLCVRRTRDGRYVVSFPGHLDWKDVKRTTFRPVTREAHQAIERPILDNLRRRGFLT